MSLLVIKSHMMQVKMTSLDNLCRLLQLDAESVRCMLSHWIKKGKIRPCKKKSACGKTCFQCPSASIELYEWAE